VAHEMRGRVSDPFQPLRAAHNLKPPALPGEYLPPFIRAALTPNSGVVR
jgi:hypothetical protein